MVGETRVTPVRERCVEGGSSECQERDYQCKDQEQDTVWHSGVGREWVMLHMNDCAGECWLCVVVFAVKDKADVLMELDRLSRVRDELTEEVTRLHGLLEQERSKVGALTAEPHPHSKHKEKVVKTLVYLHRTNACACNLVLCLLIWCVFILQNYYSTAKRVKNKFQMWLWLCCDSLIPC